MFFQMATTLFVVFVAAQDVKPDCEQSASSSCSDGQRRVGTAMLQTDVGAKAVQAPAAEDGAQADSPVALLLETGKTEISAKAKSKAAPLLGKVNALVEEVTKLDTEVGGLERAVGIGRPSTSDAVPMPDAVPVPETPPPTATLDVPAAGTTEEESLEPVAMLDSPPYEDDSFLMEPPEGLSLRQTGAERDDYLSKRPFASLQRGASPKYPKYPKAPPRAREPRNLVEAVGSEAQEPPLPASFRHPVGAPPGATFNEAAYQQPIALMKQNSGGTTRAAPAGSLKSTVAELEGRISDISSRIVSLENEVVGHAVSSLLELGSTTKLSETPMVAAALNSRVISQQKSKQAASFGGDLFFVNALKSRTLRMEETVDDLQSRANTLAHEVLR